MFPIGINSYLNGGVVIGVAVSFVYILTGTHATQSSIFTTTLSYFTKLPFFQRQVYLDSRVWRLYFASGVILGALVYTLTISPDGFWVTGLPLWKLGLGGFLVGFGTRLSRGCTSGHGISGLASLSVTSLYAVITFIGMGIITVIVVRTAGL
ncbi:YeeE/YedE family protein [Candidatus Bathyarchaeota archaeon]|nr:YeeE/YedE family protein [Candidatus Bathyarchaeota archaeon]